MQNRVFKNPDHCLTPALDTDRNSDQGVLLSRTVRLHIPKDFDASDYPKLKGKEHFAYWFLNKIIRLHTYYRHSSHNSWVHISQQTIRNFIHPDHAKMVQDLLLQNEVIECDGKYIPTVHSMGWRLGPKYRTGGFRQVTVTNKALVAKMLAARIMWIDKAVPVEELQAVHQHLHHWMGKVAIDTEKAAVLSLQRAQNQAQTTRDKTKDKKASPEYIHDRNMLVVDQIKNKELDFAICQQGRVHTPYTRLFTEGRSCLTIDGKPLVSVDIKNSQLIFFTLMLQESKLRSYAESTDRAEEKNQESNPAASLSKTVSPSCTTSSRSTLPASLSPSCTTSCPPLRFSGASAFSPSCYSQASTEQFVKMVLDGSIYDYLMVKYDELMESKTPITRSEFKPLFFEQVLYNNNFRTYAETLPLALIFQELFPEVWDFILTRKKWRGIGPKDEAWKKLSTDMQSRESTFMIGKVCARLQQHHPEIPVVTVHDSVMTTPECVEEVYRIIMEEFARLGVQPRLKVEGPTEPVGSSSPRLGSPSDESVLEAVGTAPEQQERPETQGDKRGKRQEQHAAGGGGRGVDGRDDDPGSAPPPA